MIKKKGLISCSYNQKKGKYIINRKNITLLNKSTALHICKYDGLLFRGYANVGLMSIKHFCNSFNLTGLVNKQNCFKKWEK